MLSSPALDTYVIGQHDRSPAESEVRAGEQLQRGSGDSWQHHVAQQQRDICDFDTTEFEMLAGFSCDRSDSSAYNCQSREDSNNCRAAHVRHDDVLVVVIVGVDAVEGQTDVKRKHSQCRYPFDHGLDDRGEDHLGQGPNRLRDYLVAAPDNF